MEVLQWPRCVLFHVRRQLQPLRRAVWRVHAIHLQPASRFAMHGLTSSLAIDLAPEIRVNAVAPGHILTSDILGKNALEAAQSKSLLGYGATSEEIAEAVLFLATSKSITGQTIFVDSGERMNQRRRDPALEGVDGS